MTLTHPKEFLHAGHSRMVYVQILIHWRHGYDLGITEHQAIAMPDEYQDNHFVLSEYWWSEGNGGCDCNRSRFIYPDREVDDDADRCGEEIFIRALESLDPLIPSLLLNEV